MERRITSKLFLLPALALGLIVAWTSYAGSETNIEDMSSSIGAGNWTANGCCYDTTEYDGENGCPPKDGYTCTYSMYGCRSNASKDNSRCWIYDPGDWCNAKYNGCKTGYTSSFCQDSEPSDP